MAQIPHVVILQSSLLGDQMMCGSRIVWLPVRNFYRVSVGIIKADISAEVTDFRVRQSDRNCLYSKSTTFRDVVRPLISLVFATAAFQSPARNPASTTFREDVGRDVTVLAPGETDHFLSLKARSF